MHRKQIHHLMRAQWSIQQSITELEEVDKETYEKFKPILSTVISDLEAEVEKYYPVGDK